MGGGAVGVVLAGEGASGRGVSPLSFLFRLVTRRGAAGRGGGGGGVGWGWGLGGVGWFVCGGRVSCGGRLAVAGLAGVVFHAAWAGVGWGCRCRTAWRWAAVAERSRYRILLGSSPVIEAAAVLL